MKISYPEMCEAPSFFEPTSTLKGILYCRSDVRPPIQQWKTEHLLRIPNLAAARRQWEGNGILGEDKSTKRALNMGLFIL